MIPYGCHNIEQDDINSVIKVLQSNRLTCGHVIDDFEKSLCEELNSKYAIACSNGTSALHLCMLALGINVGDTVLVPGITFLASANAARYVGADVTFVDVDPLTGLMTPESLEVAINKNKDKPLKAVVNVHFSGQCENLEAIFKIAKKHSLFIIEDASHAIGTNYITTKNEVCKVGSNTFSDLTTFSFHPVKTIAMGEGGAVTTNSLELKNKLCLFRNHGMERDQERFISQNKNKTWYYEMQHLGYNFRVSDLNCALGLSQLNKLQHFKQIRKNIVKKYDEAFGCLEKVIPIKKLNSSDSSWHLYVVLIDFKTVDKSRSELMKSLENEGVGTQVHYIPIYRQPYYEKIYGKMNLEGCEQYYDRCLSLPLYVKLEAEQQNKIVDLLHNNVK